MLERHVTDFYTPDWLPDFVQMLEPRLINRRSPNLPSSKIASTYLALFRDLYGRARNDDLIQRYFYVDRLLSLHAARIARRNDAHLFVYSGSGYWAFDALRDRKRVLFQYHPHPVSTRALLEADLDKHPEVRHSFEHEYDSLPLSKLPEENIIEWSLATQIVCSSTFCKKSLELQGCPSNRIKVIPYGSDVSSDGNGQKSPRNLRCRFLFVGQGVQRKGLHHLLKAWRRANLIDCDLTLVCYRIDPGILPLTSQPRVQIHSRMSYDKLRATYRECDVFVMPSIIEGFGLVYLEAMAAGLYCIGTRNTGLPDLNPPADVARIIDSGELDMLVDALCTTAADWRRGYLRKSASIEFASARDWRHVRTDFANFAEQILSY